jgi:hypothetical protein
MYRDKEKSRQKNFCFEAPIVCINNSTEDQTAQKRKNKIKQEEAN